MPYIFFKTIYISRTKKESVPMEAVKLYPNIIKTFM